MKLTLKRTQIRPDGIFGELRDEDGQVLAFTLEHAYGDDDSGYQPKVPSGDFTCVRGQHQLAGMDSDFTTFEITGVPDHTGILFHWGNFNKNSSGCVLLGDSIGFAESGAQMILNSRDTFAKFMKRCEGLDEFMLAVTG